MLKKTGNTYQWNGLSTGKLMMLAEMTGKMAEEHPLAHDCFHEIANVFYETDKQTYEYIQKFHKS